MQPARLAARLAAPLAARFAALAALATLGAAAVAQPIELEGPYAPDRWSDTGIEQGTVEVLETVEFFYDVVDATPSNGVSFRTAEYSTVAQTDGLLRLFYDARFRHVSFSREFFLQAFVDGPTGREVIDLVDVFDPGGATEPNNYSGVVELNTKAGFTYGFIFGGGHFTSNPNLNGNLVFIELSGGTEPFQRDASQWTAGPISEGTTGVRPAVEINYDVDLGSGGVTNRTTDLLNFATEDAGAAFNWSYRGSHTTFAANAELSLFANGENGEEVISVVDQSTSGTVFFSGRTAIDIESSNTFGIRVGGGNFDLNSFIVGNVVLSRFTATETVVEDPCPADLAAPFGELDFFDVLEYLARFDAGCDA